MDALSTMFDYHEWATLALIDHCAGLPAEVRAATVPGTHGTIQATLVHLVAADQRYVRRILNEPIATRTVSEREPIGIDELRAPFEVQAQGWRWGLENIDRLDVSLPGDEEMKDVRHAETLLFLQAVHHGNDHRTQVCTILGALGLDVPELDGWHYWMAKYQR